MLNSVDWNPVRAVAHGALQTFGEDRQLLKIQEELGELQAAIARWRGAAEVVNLDRPETIQRVTALRKAVVDEMADVMITQTQLAIILDAEASVHCAVQTKINRLRTTLRLVRGEVPDGPDPQA